MPAIRSLALIAGAVFTVLSSGCRSKETPSGPAATSPSPPGTSAPAPTRSFTSARQKTYTIRTEPDTTDLDKVEPAQPGRAAVGGDIFRGTARKAAKLSIAGAPVETFDDLKKLIDSLPAESKMTSHSPPITTDKNSNRVAEEKRNVRVSTFLYAASRENDNDFHLILGREQSSSPEMYMTMELSGLPPSDSPSFARLKAVRDKFKGFFGSDLPGTSYDFYDPPIPVVVQGSLFFDMSHSTGGRPGPASLRAHMPTIWEVHPITDMVFEP